jgi:hypothetical protein
LREFHRFVQIVALLTVVLGGLGAIFNKATPRCIPISHSKSFGASHAESGLTSVTAALMKGFRTP